MGLRIERIPTLGDNYTYLLVCEATSEAAIVDAPEADPVIAKVSEVGCKVTKILSTHHHPDHSMANPALAEKYGAPVFGHPSDSGRLPGFTDGLDEGDTISVGNETARIFFIHRTRWATSRTSSMVRRPCSRVTPSSPAAAAGCSRATPR